MPERIFLPYTNATAVPYEGSVLGHHIVLNYIDSDGVHHTLSRSARTQVLNTILISWGAFAREELLSNGTNNTDSPFQRLQINPEHIDSEVSLNQPHTMVAEGDDLSPRWALMRGLCRRGEFDGL